jgi:hypothetical protein
VEDLEAAVLVVEAEVALEVLVEAPAAAAAQVVDGKKIII